MFVYFIAINSYYFFTGTIALLRLPWYVKLHLADPVRRSTSTLDQPVTFVVPAFNEESIIVSSLRSMLALEYVNFEIVVVNDGSTDGTLFALDAAFELEPYEGIYRTGLVTQDVKEIYQSSLYPQLRVIDKINGGKGDALNAALNLARFPLVFTADADSYYHPATLQWMTEPFQQNPLTVAVGGTIAVTSAEQHLPKSLIKRFQVLEYLRAFLATRMGFAPMNGLGIVSGACGIWRKDILIECGGFRTDTIWEDMEITMRVHNYCISTGRAYNIAFTPYPVCWTDVAPTLRCFTTSARAGIVICASVSRSTVACFSAGRLLQLGRDAVLRLLRVARAGHCHGRRRVFDRGRRLRISRRARSDLAPCARVHARAVRQHREHSAG